MFHPRRLIFAAVLLAAEASADDRLVPPEVVSQVAPAYPEGAPHDAKAVEVTLLVTVDKHGHVTRTEVASSGGRVFDQAASEAVSKWTFSPARRGDRAIDSRIRVVVGFPAFGDVEHPPPAAQPPASGASKKSEPPVAEADFSSKSSDVNVLGHLDPPSRGASDHKIRIGALARVPRKDAAQLLTLAPGVFLSNEGGQGHPYQVHLRGFDAREGQDIEFTVNGVPVNEVGNVHGNGLADTHFIIPELVEQLRVVEGPFDPRQGNFAVAGSAAYELGLAERGLTMKLTTGSFGTQRGVVLWGPESHGAHTFGGAEVFKSEGYGQNRQSVRATAMAGYEASLGKGARMHVLATSYASHYAQAGVLRVDDLKAGRVGFYDTYDPQQGGDSSRHSVSVRFEEQSGDTTLAQQLFVVRRDFRLRENYTGFLEDPQQTWQTPHAQRGDLIDQTSSISTVGGRGSAKLTRKLLGRPQSLELGFLGRFDSVDSEQRRPRFGTSVPYRTDLSLASSLANIALYADANVKLASWLSVRGGLRTDYFQYLVQNRCAVREQAATSETVPDRECFASDRAGYRSADQRASTGALLGQRRVSVLFGPFTGITLNVSRGEGARSIDPQYVAQGYDTPFAKVTATEGGAAYAKTFGETEVTARSVFFQTKVDRDLFFNQTEGRATLANGTTRTGWSGSLRATGHFFDVATSLTLVRSTFDDTHLAIPYAPSLVQRTDATVWHDLPLHIDGRALHGSIASGLSYVGPRLLPYDEQASALVLVDGAARVGWAGWEVGLVATNIAGRKYRQSEYNYTSDFKSAAYPTLVPARHFAAGEPRALFLSVAARLEEAP